MNVHIGTIMADDSSYDRALERRAELLKELRDVEDFLSLHQRLFADRQDEALRPANPEAGSTRPRFRNRNVLPPARMAELAHEIIVESGRPMTRGELATAIEARGIPLAAADKAKNIGTILWRFQDRFVNVPGRGYWPSDRPIPDP